MRTSSRLISGHCYVAWTKWKVFASDEYKTDNTFPSMINALRTEWYTEAMALSTIVDKIMLDGSVSSVVYSNDESSQSVT